jgi:predicted 3-demethylubiquinone-9 3-methyltransferase (glyoxalase superfamily)
MKTIMQKIAPHLWFDNKAEEAARFYTTIFKNSKILDISYYGESTAEAARRPKGTVMTVTFELEGQSFMALNGSPVFKFSPAISFFVRCETQEEVNDLWEKLSEGGERVQCGWLSLAYHGRSFPRSWARCHKTKIQRNQKESWRHCLE